MTPSPSRPRSPDRSGGLPHPRAPRARMRRGAARSRPRRGDPAHAVVRDLDALSGADVAFAGEAGARLAAAAATAPDPPRGFVIGPAAFAQLRDAGGLCEPLADALSAVDATDRGRLMGAAQLARSLVAAAPLPPALAEELEQAYRALVRDDRDAPVVVSLSEAEPLGVDGPAIEAHGTGGFMRAVRRCWAAQFDARRVYARAVRGLPQLDPGAAVVVRRAPGR